MVSKPTEEQIQKAVEMVKREPDRRCIETTVDGSRCESFPLIDEERCFFHSDDPEVVERRVAAQQRGGELGGRKGKYVRGTPVPIESLDDVLSGLGEVISNLHEMDRSLDQCRCLIRAYQVGASCFTEREDREQLKSRIDELREAMGILDE